jgi:hypothetical protein
MIAVCMYCGCKTDRVRERGDRGAGGAWMSGEGLGRPAWGWGWGSGFALGPVKITEWDGPMQAHVACPQRASNFSPYCIGMRAHPGNGLRFSCGAPAGSPRWALTIGYEGPMQANVACHQRASNLDPHRIGMKAPHGNGLRFSCGASAGSPQRALTIGSNKSVLSGEVVRGGVFRRGSLLP